MTGPTGPTGPTGLTALTGLAEPELGESDDPGALVRGDATAVRATAARLVELAEGCTTAASGLRRVPVDGWTGAAADGFRGRLAATLVRWSRAADAFAEAAKAWDRFAVALLAAQEQAGEAVTRFRSGATAAAVARDAHAVAMAEWHARAAVGRAGPPPVLDDSGGAECASARQLLADARAARTAAASAAAAAIAEAAAMAPDPPTGADRRVAEVVDWLGEHADEFRQATEGLGEGVESLVRSARVLNPADPYNLSHPRRFAENVSAAAADAVTTLGLPLRPLTAIVGAGWGTDPARAFGRLVPQALTAAVGEGRTPRARPGTAPSTVARPRAELWTDPRPTARPFAVRPVGEPSAVADHTVAAMSEALARVEARVAALTRTVHPDEVLPGSTVPTASGLTDLPAAGPEPVTGVVAVDPTGIRGPHHDSGRARRARLTRADKDFRSPLSRSGARKSHLDERGDLVPANPDGATTVAEHVVGRRSRAKIDSPYSSFTGPSARAEVDFGGFVIEVDVVGLQADIDAGRVTDVDVLAPHRVQAAIQADADRIAGRPVDLYVRQGRIDAAARSYGLSRKSTALLRQRMIDMANAQRHHEWMIRGIVPGRYILGPHQRAG